MEEKKKPKYREIYEHLHEAIKAGAYRAGDRLPSETELVRKFGASRITVARALRELQVDGLVHRRAGSGSFVRAKTVVVTEQLGLLIPDLGQTEIFEPICQGMAQAWQSGRYMLLWGRTLAGSEPKEEQAEEICHDYISKRVSGVFFAPLELTPAKDEVNRRIVEAFDKAGIRIVLLDRDIEAWPRRSRYDLIGIDNRRAGYAITEHLLKLGCRRLVFLARPNSAPTVDARIAGFREALYAYSAEVCPEFVQRADPSDTQAVSRVMDQVRPEGFVCANDLTAAHLMRSLSTVGFGVPDDVRIVGIDDVKYAGLLTVPLTTLRQPCQDIGAAAVSVMLERLAHPNLPARDILLDFTLVVRESCGARRKAQFV